MAPLTGREAVRLTRGLTNVLRSGKRADQERLRSEV